MNLMVYKVRQRQMMTWPDDLGHTLCHSASVLTVSFMSLHSSFVAFNRTESEVEDEQDHDSAEERIPTAWWVGGLLVSGAFCTALLTPMLHLPVIDPLAAVGLALLVAVLAVRALGQTDLNPVSGVGKLSQVGCCDHSKVQVTYQASTTGRHCSLSMSKTLAVVSFAP